MEVGVLKVPEDEEEVVVFSLWVGWLVLPPAGRNHQLPTTWTAAAGGAGGAADGPQCRSKCLKFFLPDISRWFSCSDVQ